MEGKRGNKEALRESALACLLDRGYARTTARDIAGRANTSLGAIGYHFGSTEHLLQEALADGFRLWRRRFAEVVEANARRPADEILTLLADTLSSLLVEHRPLLRAFLEALVVGDRAPELRRNAASLYAEERLGIAGLVRAVRGEERTDDLVVASLLQATVDGLIVQTAISPDNAPSAHELLDVLRPILTGTGVETR